MLHCKEAETFGLTFPPVMMQRAAGFTSENATFRVCAFR